MRQLPNETETKLTRCPSISRQKPSIGHTQLSILFKNYYYFMWLDLLWQSILVNMVITISPHATWNSQEVMIDVCTCICNSLFVSTTSSRAAGPLSSREETIARPQLLPRAQRRATRDSKLQTRNLPKWHFWCASGGGDDVMAIQDSDPKRDEHTWWIAAEKEEGVCLISF